MPSDTTATTPPSKKTNNNKCPRLTRNNKFRLMSDDVLEAARNYTKNDVSCISDLLSTPPKKATNSTVSCAGKTPSTDKQKRLTKRLTKDVEHFSPSKKPKTFESPTTSATEQTSVQAPLICGHFSELKYIEAIGTVRMIRKKKHRGISSPNSSQIAFDLDADAICNEDMNLSSSYWDRNVRLQISYRINLSNNDVQFALIIYEHVTKNPRTRRNLMSEFSEVVDTNASITGNTNAPNTDVIIKQTATVNKHKHQKTQISVTHAATKAQTPFKRLRF